MKHVIGCLKMVVMACALLAMSSVIVFTPPPLNYLLVPLPVIGTLTIICLA
jgi:hypothetical protein